MKTINKKLLKAGGYAATIYAGLVFADIIFFIILARVSDIFNFTLSGKILAPLIIPTFYPGIWIAGDYQSTFIILFINLLCYSLLGILIRFIIELKRSKQPNL